MKRFEGSPSHTQRATAGGWEVHTDEEQRSNYTKRDVRQHGSVLIMSSA